jgi:hypothetical protein
MDKVREASGPELAAVLPPELFPLIADAFAHLNAKRTLVELLCTNKQTYALCLPSLMRNIDISEWGFTAERVARLLGNRDALKYAKSLKLSHHISSEGNMMAFCEVWDCFRGLDSLECGVNRHFDKLATLIWSLLLRQPHVPALRRLEFYMHKLNILTAEILEGECFALPETITEVEMRIDGTEAQRTYVLRCLDALPRLEKFVLHVNGAEHRNFLSFLGLFRRMRYLHFDWRLQS